MSGRLTLLSYETPELRVTHEVRPAEFVGPQRACHPNTLELCLIEHGCENSRLGRVEYLHPAGEYVLIPPGVEHTSWTKARGVRECIVHLPCDVLDQLAGETGAASPRTWSPGGYRTPPQLDAAVAALRKEVACAALPGHDLLTGSLVTQIGVLLMRRHSGACASEDRGSGARAQVRRVEERMRAAPGDAFALDDLAAIAGMSRWQFLRAFKTAFGLPPHAYLLKLRVEEAARRMRETDLPLTIIASDLGFGSSSRLTEAFRRAYGVAPSRWRQAHAKSGN